MSYDEFKKLCKRSWEEDNEYFFIDRSKKRGHGKFCVCNESNNMYRMHS